MMLVLASANPVPPTPTRQVLPCARYHAPLARLRSMECVPTAQLVPSRTVDLVCLVLPELTMPLPDRPPVKSVPLEVSALRVPQSVLCALLGNSRIRRALETVKCVLLDNILMWKVLPPVKSVPLEPTTEKVVPLRVLFALLEPSLSTKDRYPVKCVRLVHLLFLLPSVLSAPSDLTVLMMVPHLVHLVPQDSIVEPRVSLPPLDLVKLDITVRRGLPPLNRTSALPVTSVQLEVPSLLSVLQDPTNLLLQLLSVMSVMPGLIVQKRVL